MSSDEATNAEPPTDEDAVARVKWYRSWPQVQILLIGLVALGGIACMCVAVVVLALWRR